MSEERGFDELYRRTGPRLWRAVYVYTGGRRDLADDVVAEAFARTLRRGGDVRAPEAYLYRVAFRLAAAELRRSPTVPEVPDPVVRDDHGLVEVLDALRRLSPGQRAAVFLHHHADLPVAEVARLMATLSAVVRVQLVRGRRKLRELLGEGSDG